MNIGGERERGFTLIELLIVVAIIGVLAAIAIPAFLGQQKKAKWRALQSSCEGASKQASAFLSDLAKLDPVILLAAPSLRVCYAHVSKQRVDTDSDGNPDTDACQAKFAGLGGNTGTYAGTMAGGVFTPSPTLVQDLAHAIRGEACGGLEANPNTLNGFISQAVPPWLGLMKVSPHHDMKCVFAVPPAGTGFVADTYAGQCLIAPNENAKTMQLMAIEDKGDNTDGEIRQWTASAD